MKLTTKERKLVKEYAKKLVGNKKPLKEGNIVQNKIYREYDHDVLYFTDQMIDYLKYLKKNDPEHFAEWKDAFKECGKYLK